MSQLCRIGVLVPRSYKRPSWKFMRACNAPATGQTDAGVPACDRCLAAIKAMEKTRP